MRFASLAFAALSLWASGASAAFGLSQDSSYFTVDAGSSNSLVFKVAKSTCDITSILYRGVELQTNGPYSHINSGMGSGTSVSGTTIGDYIKITCVNGSLTHYYVVRKSDSTIFMATHITAQPSIGELRYIARLRADRFPNSNYPESNTAGSSSTVEGSDVFIVNGQTRSKFYSSERFIDDEVHCIWGNDQKACMVIPDPTGYETSSGGPFMRDINFNLGGDRHDLYWYHNSGHANTEANKRRLGLYGPFALVFSRSGEPSKTLDTSFFEQLSIKDYVPKSQRGYVSGSVSGIPSNFPAVVHWYNDKAQYWTYASSNRFTSPPMKPGTYTMALYKNELLVRTQSVNVNVGQTTSSNIASGEFVPSNSVWKIGEFDGTPTGFLNADKQLRMHPSDSRMSNWGPVTFTIGDNWNRFPMAQIKAVNNPTTIKFSTSDTSGTFKLRIATTLAFSNGRPQVSVNSWSSSTPAAPEKIDSRGFTRGAYRGHGESYEWTLPSGTIKSGENQVWINVASGNSGDGFLSPNFIYDAVELYKA